MTDTMTRPPAAWAAGVPIAFPETVVPRLILERAARRPEAVAVRQWDERITYGELAARSGALAGQLIDLGVTVGDRVGICMRRTPSVMVAILGVLRAGAAYVPLDPRGPGARVARMLDDAAIDVVVVDEATVDVSPLSSRRRVRVPPAGHGIDSGQAGPAGPDDAAYVLYTSGSTGQPKGVVITHRSVVEFTLSWAATTGADATMRALGLTSLGFDVSVTDLLVTAVAGGEICLVGDEDRADPGRLQRFAAEHRVTWGFVSPALLPLLDPAGLPDWRVVMTGGEAPGPDQVLRWAGPAQAPVRRFINGYGPTETTVFATAYETAGRWDGPVPIGSPVPNHRAYVVDANLDRVAVGVPGELLVGGPGLAQGYLGDPALTARRFIPDPFGDTAGARLYRTGDRVMWQPDGTLQFLGRDDGQVKIRGQRIEVGEVEAVLCTHPDIDFAVVLAQPGPAGLELVAFCAPEHGLSADQFRSWCGDRLTSAMIPTRLVSMAALPLSATGKVDRGALRELDAVQSGPAPPAPQGAHPRPGTPVQRAVAQAWHELLGGPLEQITLDDEFFAAGGHSIVAMRLVAEVRRRLGRAFTVEDVFVGRTVGEIARRAAEAPAISGPERPTGSPPALSNAQRRLWFIDQLAPDVSPYNIPVAYRLRGPLDVTALREALNAVADRHEVLRWRMPARRGIPTAVLAGSGPTPLPVEEVPDAGGERQVVARLAEIAAARFDLENGPLWRVNLLRVADDEHILAITFQHAVFDGWSLRPYLADLEEAYAAARSGKPIELPALPASFADYVGWREARDAERGPADLAWWTGHLAGAPVVLDLPTDRHRPAVQTYPGAREVGDLPVRVAQRLRGLATTLGATMPAVLLAGFGQLLHRLTGATDMIVGTPAADRRHLDFHQLVGFFIDIVPLRMRIDPSTGFASAVRAANTELFDALGHPAAPLERIVHALSVPRDLTRPPLVQVLFNVYNFPDPHLELAGLETVPVPAGLPGSPFDLTTYVVERDGTYTVEMVYNTDLFDAARVRDMVDGYLRLLDELSADPGTPSGSAWRQALPDQRGTPTAPSGSADGSAAAVASWSAGPTSATELLVQRTWCEVLERDRVGVTDNFFDIGGTSLAIVAVQARLAELLGRRVTLVDLFRYPNVRALAGFLDSGGIQPEQTRGALRAAARRERRRATPARPAPNDEGGTR